MFKFSKVLVFMFLTISLIACSTETSKQPEDIRNEIWSASNGILDEVISYYEDSTTLNVETIQKHGESLQQYHRDKNLTSAESLLIDHITDLSTYTFMLNEGYTEAKLKESMFYDYELELKIVKELLNR